MKTVYKYTIDVGAYNNPFETARILRVLHVAPENDIDRVNVWCEVDTDAKEVVSFSIIGTGHPVPVNMKHYGTAVMPSGLVWHVYGHPSWSYGP